MQHLLKALRETVASDRPATFTNLNGKPGQMRREHFSIEGTEDDAQLMFRLRESERRFRNMLENVNLIAMTLDTTGKITFCNDYLLRVTGWKRRDVEDADWFEMFIPKGDSVKDLFHGTIDHGTIPPHYENPILTRDGRLRHVRWNNTMLHDSEGKVVGVASIGEDITDRRKTEEELRSRTALSEALVQSSLDGIIVVNRDGKTILQNQRAVEFWKMPEEIAREVDDKKRIEFVLSQTKDPRGFVAKIEQLYACPLETSHDEIELVDGATLDRISAPVIDASGANLGRVWSFRDVTDQKRSAEQIVDALNFNRTILEAAPFGIMTYRASGENVSANDAAARLVGAKPSEIANQNFRHIEAWRQAGLLAAADRALEQRKEQEMEAQFVTSFGKPVWLAFRFAPFYHAGEQHLMVMFNDIDERKRSEDALRESQERFQQLAENIEEVFWMTDPSKGQILYVSPGYEKVWGRPVSEAQNNPQTWSEAIHPSDRDRVRAAAATQQIVGNYNETYRVVRPDGGIRWIQDRAFPIRNQAGVVYRIVGLAEDITASRQLEEQFRQAQKMEAIGTLAGGIAHDFNNILAAILGYTELARMDLEDKPNTFSQLGEVLQAANRAKGLVQQILAFSRKHPHERKVIQLRHVVAEALKLLRATIPATISFKNSLSPEAHPVLADAVQVHQIIMNLATNAWHAMKDRPGVLDVTLDNCIVDHAFAAQNPELHPGPYVRLSVADTGHGMDESTLQHIFEPFFTTKGLGEGTGLGLAVVHGIMKTHEGAVTVESKLGEGTTFHVFFPAQQKSVPQTNSGSAAIPRGAGERILLLDDEPPLVALWKIALERLGYFVEPFTNPVEALAAIKSRHAEIDLVVTDLAMPGMGGIEFTRAVHQVRGKLPIILTTGYPANVTVENARTSGISDLLLKPLNLEALGISVHRALTAPA